MVDTFPRRCAVVGRRTTGARILSWVSAPALAPALGALAVGALAVGTLAFGAPAVGALVGGPSSPASSVHATAASGGRLGGRSSAAGHRFVPAGAAVVGPDVTPATTAAPVAPVVAPTTTLPAAVATAPTVPAPPAPVPAATPVGPTPDALAVLGTQVSQVEASGIAPGPTWSWSFGDTSRCGAIPGTNAGTGCTAGAAGSVTTVFSGAPGSLLVAHELANAEVENYAVRTLVDLVAREAGGSSWSPIDAVASCLVVHFMHVQDGAAGPWACPAGLADIVGAHIRDAAFAG